MGFARNRELLQKFHEMIPMEIDPQTVYLCEQNNFGLDLDTVLQQWKCALLSNSSTCSIFEKYVSEILPNDLVIAMKGVINYER